MLPRLSATDRGGARDPGYGVGSLAYLYGLFKYRKTQGLFRVMTNEIKILFQKFDKMTKLIC